MAERAFHPIAAADRRAWLYDWLGGIFAQPLTEARIAAHLTGPGAAFLADLEHDPVVGSEVSTMLRALRSETCERALGTVFSLLFLGVGGPAQVPPYESAFTDPNGRLFQQATARMEDALRRLDLSVDPACVEPPDHLAIELMVMVQLVLRGEIAAQAKFLEQHLSWVPTFADLCGERDPSGFYAAAARALAGFLEEERLALSEAASATLEREIA
jgi:TorA specific chaperone